MARAGRPVRSAAGWLLFTVVLVSLHVWPDRAPALYSASIVLITGGGAILHGRNAWRSTGRARRVWSAAAVGLGCWSAAEISVGVPTVVTGDPPTPSLAANLLNLVALVCAVAAMLSIPGAPRDRFSLVRMLLDGVVAAAALSGVVWMLLLNPLIRAEDSAPSPFLLAYPVVATGVLAVGVVLMAGQPVRWTTSMTRVTSGVVVLTLSLLLEMLTVAEQTWLHPCALDGYLIAAMLMALSARVPLPDDEERIWQPIGAGILLPYIPVAALFLTAAGFTLAGRPVDPPATGAALIMTAAVLTRQLLALQANARLTADLDTQRAQLMFEATHDALTGLPNRARLQTALADLTDLARADGAPAEQSSLLMIDLDGFKNVNDTLGHAAGDQLLVVVADRIRSAVAAYGDIALPVRLGGDEFAVLLHGGGAPTAVELAQERVLSIGTPMSLDGHPATVGASIGIAVHGRAERMLHDADVALYEAKARGKGHYRLFDERLSAAVAARQSLEADLGGALGGGQLALEYQPMVDLMTGEAHRCEALLRWNHPTRGRLTPDRFLTAAQHVGLLPALDRWVLGTAAAQVAAWRRIDPEYAVSVNASAAYLASGTLPRDMRRVLETHGLPGSALTVEVTESSLIANLEATAGLLAELRELGVRVALDDFGVGYSSLTYLRQLPVDVVKLDRSFTRELGTGPDAVILVDGVLDLAYRLGLETVAEGVETDEQADQLRALGCRNAQGFRFGPPRPPDDTHPPAAGDGVAPDFSIETVDALAPVSPADRRSEAAR